MISGGMVQGIRFGIAVVACACPIAGSAVEPQVHAAPQQTVLVLGPVGRGSDVVETISIPGGAMLYRFAVEAAGDSEWEVVLSTGSGSSSSQLARLSPHSPQFSLPRPLAYLIEPRDSITVQARAMGGEYPVTIRLELEFETLDATRRRLPVLPLPAHASDPNGYSAPGTRSWEWQAPVAGRVMAMAGLALLHATELILQDVETGAVVWRETVQQSPEAFGGSADVVRAGISVQAGRNYRLTAIGVAGGSLDASHTPQAMLLPARSAGMVAVAN